MWTSRLPKYHGTRRGRSPFGTGIRARCIYCVRIRRQRTTGGRNDRMSEKTESLRFSSLRLQNWKNFVRIEVDLQNRVFLVGPNAAGKSNFLDVFRFLRDLASPG